MAEVAGLGEQLKADEERLAAIQAQMQDFLLNVPNLLFSSTKQEPQKQIVPSNDV